MPNPEQLLRQAQLWHQQGQLPQAESAYRQILAQAPQHAYALHYLGLLLAQQQHYAEALPLLVQSCQQQPDNWSFFTNLGEAQRRAGELENAQKSCRQALFLNPDFAEAHFNLANLLKQLGQLEGAVGHYQQALKTQPQHVKALFNLGITHRQLGQSRLAMATFEKVLKLDPVYAEAHINLGAALEEFYELEEALKHYQFAFWLKPDFRDALVNIAHVQEALGYVDEAHRTLQQLRAEEPDNLVLYLSQAGMFSSVPFSNYEIDNYRQRLFSALQSILEADLSLDLLKEDRMSCQPSMELPYHGRDDRPLKEAYAKIFGKYLPPFEPRPRHTGKQKIGFVVTFGHESVFIKCMAGILQGFSLAGYELTMVCSQPECDYLNLIAHSAAVLDTLYYTGGANTILDAFACGTPVITLPTRFHRGRFTAAAYEQIGLSSCVALDTKDYIAKAIQLGTDPASRRQISQELVEASAELFEDPRPAKELEDCLLSLCQA